MEEKWLIKGKSKEEKNELSELKKKFKDKLSSVSIDILYNRGIKTEEKINHFLFNGLDNLYDANLFKDSDKFLEIVENGIKNNKHFVLYGDFDSDGCNSMVVCALALKKLGAKVDCFCNNRFDEGYGICPQGVEHLKEKFPTCDIIITLDNGIVGFDGVNKANEYGMKVIVTDHHEASDDGRVPNAVAVIDAKQRGCKYPFKELCGTGVIFKLMILLYRHMNKDISFVYDMVDFVAVATVGDLVSLTDENRIIVREGLKAINNSKRLFFKYLKEKIEVDNVDEYTLGFRIVPMINAMGRIDGTPIEVVEASITENKDKAKEIIDKMFDTNEYRKELTEKQENICLDKIDEENLRKIIVLADKSFHKGIVGLVAGRIKDLYNRPTIVFSYNEKEGLYEGSCRSIDGFPIKDSLDKIKNILVKYGGHPMAAGVTIKEENLKIFEKEINRVADETLSDDDFNKKIYLDCVLNPSDIKIKLISDIEILRPFGIGFKKPVFGLNNFFVSKKYYMGESKKHLKLKDDGGLELLMFNGSDYYKEIKEPFSIKALGYPKINNFRDNISVQFIVRENGMKAV